MPPTILITGSSSGLGLAFTTHFASLSPSPKIIALDQTPPPPSLHSLPNTTFHTLDITSPSSLKNLLSPTTPISLLVHCAGTRGLVPAQIPQNHGDVGATESLGVMDRDTMIRTFEVNTWGAFNVVTAVLPNLRLVAGKGGDGEGEGMGEGIGNAKAKVVLLSSRMGSIAANQAGGGYAYRASKAALNAVVKSLCIDVPEVDFLLLHPGRVETGLVEWKEEGAMSVDESLRDCLEVIEKLGKDADDSVPSGAFVDRFGVEIQW